MLLLFFLFTFADFAQLNSVVKYSDSSVTLTVDQFQKSGYEFGLGMYNTKGQMEDHYYHYMLVNRSPFLQNDPGMRQTQYYLQFVRTIWFEDRK